MTTEKKGVRVYIKTPLVEGWATVTHYIAGEMFPIQVELDEGDGDGHKVYRVRRDEIVQKGEVSE